jgi:signal peptidase II
VLRAAPYAGGVTPHDRRHYRATSAGGTLATPAVVVALVGLGVAGTDQALKEVALRWWAEPVPVGPGVSLALSFNTGAAFSTGTSLTPLFTVLACAAVAGVVWVAGRAASRPWAVAFGLLGGGAAGNLVDRFVRPPGFARGAVVDYVDVSWFAAFNLADAALTAGVVLALVLSGRGGPALSPRRRRRPSGQ